MNFRGLTQVATPVLAGFALATIGVLLTTEPRNRPPTTEVCLAALVSATALLLSSMQFSFLAGGGRLGVFITAILYLLGVMALTLSLGFLLWPRAYGFIVGGLVVYLPPSLLVLRRILTRPERRPWRDWLIDEDDTFSSGR
jgi:hypothetical protein